MWAVPCRGDRGFDLQARTFLFRNDYDPEQGGHQHYDVASDGRFLMVRNDVFAPNRLYVRRP